MDKELTDFIIIEYSSDISRAEGLKKHILDKTNFRGVVYISQLSPSGGAILGLGLSYVSKSSGDAFVDLFRGVGAITKTS